MKFVSESKQAWKMFSVRVAAIWGAIIAFLAADPMFIVTAWNAIPVDLRDSVPTWVRFVVVFGAVFGSIVLARLVKQKSIKKPEYEVEEK